MDLFRGLVYPLRGFAILSRNPGLAVYWLPPIVITFAALVASVLLTIAYSDDLTNLIWRPAAQAGATGFLVGVAHGVLHVFSFVLGLGLLVVVCVALSTLLAAPFNDALSEAVEVRETGAPTPPFSVKRLVRDLGRTVRLELTKLSIYVAVMGPLLVASWLLPGVGQVLYVLFGTLFTSAYFAFDYIDWPASRRGLGFRERARLLADHPLRALGFGFAVWLCLFVPLLNLAFMPLAVAGGTRLFLDVAGDVATGVRQPRSAA
jgi:CysZ protein